MNSTAGVVISDSKGNRCEKLEYINTAEIGSMLVGSFKVPGLRNLAKTAPYMHDGRFADIHAVLSYYRNPPEKYKHDESHELSALRTLDDKALQQLAAFLNTLNSSKDPESRWFKSP